MKKIWIIIFGMFLIAVAMLNLTNATIFDKLNELKIENCAWVNYGKVDSSEFVNKLNLRVIPENEVEQNDCVFITDFNNFEGLTYNFTKFWNLSNYGIIYYVEVNEKTNFFILGNNSPNLRYIIKYFEAYELYNETIFSEENYVTLLDGKTYMKAVYSQDSRRGISFDFIVSMIVAWATGDDSVGLSDIISLIKTWISG